MKQLQQSFINDDGRYSYQCFNCYYFYNPLDPAPWPLPGIVEMVRRRHSNLHLQPSSCNASTSLGITSTKIILEV